MTWPQKYCKLMRVRKLEMGLSNGNWNHVGLLLVTTRIGSNLITAGFGTQSYGEQTCGTHTWMRK